MAHSARSTVLLTPLFEANVLLFEPAMSAEPAERSPGWLLRVGRQELLLADGAQSAHEDDDRVPAQAAAAHVHLLYAFPARPLRPVYLHHT